MRRRDWFSMTSGAGLAFLGEVLRQRPARAREVLTGPSAGFGRAKSVLVVVASGGQSQLETFDPRPEAPLEVRGQFGAIETTVPGTFLCEHLPRLAKLAHRYAIVKSMSHDDLDHGSALYLTLTGQYHQRLSSNPPPRETDHPFFGSVLEQTRPASKFLRTSVLINGPALVPFEPGPGQFAGLLGRRFDSLVIGDVTTGQPAVPGLERLDNVDAKRHALRQQLLHELEQNRLPAAQPTIDMQTLYQQAYEMLDRPTARQALDLEAEPQSIRDRYGRHRSGQACLLARRLVEAEVPLVTVMWNHSNRGQDKYPDDVEQFGWDTHNDIFDVMGGSLLPRFDQSFSALLEDLDQRGLLETTLVVCMGEFGRAPVVALESKFAGASPGRKHWAAAYSIVLAGAGVRGGSTIGATDRHAAYPISTKYGPWDVTATIFHALGIDPAGHFFDSLNRPYPISSGQPITGLW
ncbi:MAG: DUF1501 domain-containing protein [Planctomycetales bacterium]|nr:DUF1501 domain-containing protein [Planctomycetales bacterium]